MLKVKLARFGKKNQPHYRIVINEARDKRDGKYIANIGTYAPAQIPKILEIEMDAYEAWLKKGAQPTDTVASLVARYKSGDPFPAKKPKASKKTLAKQAAVKAEALSAVETSEEAAKVAETPVETPAEAPVEPEVKTETEASNKPTPESATK